MLLRNLDLIQCNNFMKPIAYPLGIWIWSNISFLIWRRGHRNSVKNQHFGKWFIWHYISYGLEPLKNEIPYKFNGFSLSLCLSFYLSPFLSLSLCLSLSSSVYLSFSLSLSLSFSICLSVCLFLSLSLSVCLSLSLGLSLSLSFSLSVSFSLSMSLSLFLSVSLSFSIVHCSGQVFNTPSSVRVEMGKVSFCWSANIGESICSCPSENKETCWAATLS